MRKTILSFFFNQPINSNIITKRIVGIHNGLNYYIHPVFNEKNSTLKLLKDFVIERKISRIKQLDLLSLLWFIRGLLSGKIRTSRKDDFYWNLDV